MQVTPTSISFTPQNKAVAQTVKVTGLAAQTTWTAKATAGITVAPASGTNDVPLSVTGPGLRAGSPGTITVAAPGQPSITVSVSITA